MVNGTDYNILRDAKLAQAGQKLSNDMGIKREDYLLVAVFSPSKEITDEPQNRSAICMYSLKDIEEVFNENIHCTFAFFLCVLFLSQDSQLTSISFPATQPALTARSRIAIWATFRARSTTASVRWPVRSATSSAFATWG